MVSFLLMLPWALIAFFASQAILSKHDILQVSFSDHGVARAVLGAAATCSWWAILGLAIGAIVRNTAGGISAFAAIFFVIPPLLSVLPTSWDHAINPYLPSTAGAAIFALTRDPHTLSPGAGLALFVRLRRAGRDDRGAADGAARHLAAAPGG